MYYTSLDDEDDDDGNDDQYILCRPFVTLEYGSRIFFPFLLVHKSGQGFDEVKRKIMLQGSFLNPTYVFSRKGKGSVLFYGSFMPER